MMTDGHAQALEMPLAGPSLRLQAMGDAKTP